MENLSNSQPKFLEYIIEAHNIPFNIDKIYKKDK